MSDVQGVRTWKSFFDKALYIRLVFLTCAGVFAISQMIAILTPVSIHATSPSPVFAVTDAVAGYMIWVFPNGLYLTLSLLLDNTSQGNVPEVLLCCALMPATAYFVALACEKLVLKTQAKVSVGLLCLAVLMVTNYVVGMQTFIAAFAASK